MKRYDVLNLETKQALYLSRFGLNRLLRRYEKRARKILKRTNADHVMYGVVHGSKSANPSYHIVPPTPHMKSARMDCLRGSEPDIISLIVRRKV